MASISLQGIKKSFDQFPVITDADIAVDDGEFMVFVGPSGCGKSTMLRMIAGLEGVTDGTIRFGDEFVHEKAPAERGAAMVFQSYALYPHMTVAENMGFSLKMAGVPRKKCDEQVQVVAETLKLDQLMHRFPKELSGGQRQRVAIGRAIVRRPKVFLFDEPLSNLDAALRVEMRVELSRLHKRLGTTMIYVTHDQTEAMTLGDRIAVFNAGKIEQIGEPLELYKEPANRFVAEFIGSPKINVFDVVFDTDSSLVTLKDFGSLSFQSCDLTQGQVEAGETLGIRAENFEILLNPENDGLVGVVDLVEKLGDLTVTYIRSSLGEDGQVVTVKTVGDVEVSAGDKVGLRPSGPVMVFDRDGKRIDA
jgi:ABC-type sugar transport system ATPase subunit